VDEDKVQVSEELHNKRHVRARLVSNKATTSGNKSFRTSKGINGGSSSTAYLFEINIKEKPIHGNMAMGLGDASFELSSNFIGYNTPEAHKTYSYSSNGQLRPGDRNTVRYGMRDNVTMLVTTTAEINNETKMNVHFFKNGEGVKPKATGLPYENEITVSEEQGTMYPTCTTFNNLDKVVLAKQWTLPFTTFLEYIVNDKITGFINAL